MSLTPFKCEDRRTKKGRPTDEPRLPLPPVADKDERRPVERVGERFTAVLFERHRAPRIDEHHVGARVIAELSVHVAADNLHPRPSPTRRRRGLSPALEQREL